MSCEDAHLAREDKVGDEERQDGRLGLDVLSVLLCPFGSLRGEVLRQDALQARGDGMVLSTAHKAGRS